jgi:hypothetical protein
MMQAAPEAFDDQAGAQFEVANCRPPSQFVLPACIVRVLSGITLTVTTEVHDKLKKLKIGNESFSAMLTRELPDRANTCGEVLKKLEGKELPPMDPILLKAVRCGRGRRSNRRSRHAR